VSFVLDASAVLSIAFEEEAATRVEDLLIVVEAVPVVVPAIWATEVANVLIVGERRRRIDSEKTGRFLKWLLGVPIESDVAGTLAALDRALPLARRFDLTAYDALYLELAQRKGLPLATFDRQLAAAAKKLSIQLVLD
jgi:predicted nucleic acid-binding protein